MWESVCVSMCVCNRETARDRGSVMRACCVLGLLCACTGGAVHSLTRVHMWGQCECERVLEVVVCACGSVCVSGRRCARSMDGKSKRVAWARARERVRVNMRGRSAPEKRRATSKMS